MKMYTFPLSQQLMLMTKRKISVRNKEYTNNKFKYQREERIQINSAKEMGHSVVVGVEVKAGVVIGPSYRVAVGLERDQASSCLDGSIGGGVAISTLLGGSSLLTHRPLWIR